MKTKLIKLALSFFSSDDGRKFVRNVAVVIISPFVAITVLIGAIFSDGISFNHNLVTDLFEGNPISELTGEMKQYVQEIQDGLVLIDSHIDKINQTFTNGSSLNIYQVKGYLLVIWFLHSIKYFQMKWQRHGSTVLQRVKKSKSLLL